MSCSKCNDTGIIVTGNNDIPCDCDNGNDALFNVAGHAQPISGEELHKGLINQQGGTNWSHYAHEHEEDEGREDVPNEQQSGINWSDYAHGYEE